MLFSALLVQQSYPREFVFRSGQPLASVHLAGTFNNWSASATPMSSDGEKKVWRITKSLPPGRHLYKFVLNGSDWRVDPENPKSETDGSGHTNSILLVLPPDYATPANPRDGRVTLSALAHRQAIPDLNLHRGQLTVRLSMRPGDSEKVELEFQGRRLPMRQTSSDDISAIYEAAAPWTGSGSASYRFRITDGASSFIYGPDGLSQASQAKSFQLTPQTFQAFRVPGWTEGAVFYQIFPERFENGDKSNDPAGVLPWDGKPEYFNFFGGDLKGIENRLGHLRGLGVQGVYLNPIFRSPSNHGYETIDYKLVEPRFGTNSQFKSLVATMQRQGIKVVLDGVFNHSATDFPQFQSVRQQGEASRFKNWFFIKSYPVVVQANPPYEAWFGFPSMPKLNLDNPEVSSYFMGVLDFWRDQANIDGWRLDVANEVSPAFWRQFRTHLKKSRPDNWIVGEHWGDGRAWLSGDQWDSMMGYQFRFATIDFVAKGSIPASAYMKRLMDAYSSYPPQVSHSLMNLLGSHDTPRFLTEAGGDRELAKLGATMLLTWPGAPSIYYGDELGMAGGADPENRRGMQWELATPQNDLLSHYRRLVQLRRGIPALRAGDPTPLISLDSAQVAAFGRRYLDSTAVVAVNRSTSPQTIEIPVPAEYRWSGRPIIDRLTDRPAARLDRGTLRLTLAAKSATVLVPSAGNPSSHTQR